jgi:hypothetical protein
LVSHARSGLNSLLTGTAATTSRKRRWWCVAEVILRCRAPIYVPHALQRARSVQNARGVVSRAGVAASTSVSYAHPPISTTEMSLHNPNYVGGDVITRRKHGTPVGFSAPCGTQPVRDRHPRRPPMFGGYPAGSGGSRDVWVQCGAGRTAGGRGVT